MSDIIKVLQGELLEGETVELFADFSCNYVSNLFKDKRWLVIGEKDLKFDSLTQEYYNDTSKQNIFDSVGDDYITLTELKVGRYLAVFTYTDLLGRKKEEKEMLTVFPKFELVYDKDITEGDTKNIKVTTSLLNTTSVVTFSDNNDQLILSDVSKDRVFPLEGYHTANIQVEYSNAKYDEENEPKVIWKSQPSNRLVGVSGPYGDGISVNTSFTNIIEDIYLTKLEISTSSLSDKININLSVSFNGDEAYAPTNVYIIDRSTYFTLFGEKKQYWNMTTNLPTDTFPLLENGNPDPDYFLPLGDIFTSDHRIDYTEIYFGDGQIIRGNNIGFEYQKNYEKSGKYQIKYVIYTRHYVDLNIETTDTKLAGLIKDELDGRLYYTNTLEHIEEFEVKAFFTKWLRQHTPKTLYGTDGFNDISTALGKQLDRLYNQGKSIIDSIDVETIDDKFIKNYFETYGDFEEIAKKVGFSGFTKDKDDIYNFFEGYNFFDRVSNGKATDIEKAEFLNYIRSTQERLQTKGTPSSIERELNQFGIQSEVVELWTDNMDKVVKDDILLDEVFSGKDNPYSTGLTYEASSTPISDNTASLITNSTHTPYIEINSFNEKKNFYFTKDTTIQQKGCTKYAKFDNVITDVQAIEYVFEILFDQWADNCIGNGLWARKYTNDFDVLGNFRWIDLLEQDWSESVIETLKRIGTDALYNEFLLRWGEMGKLIWKSFNLELWDSDLEAPTTFVQGISGENTILSLESGQVIFGEYSQKSFEVGQILYFKTTDVLTSAYIKDVHGVTENFESLNDGVWDTDITLATAYLDEFFHYKVTIPSITTYFKGWVFSSDDGFVFSSDDQFRLECVGVDILTVEFEENNVEEVIEEVSNLTSFVEATFRCIPIIPEEIEEIIPEIEKTSQEFGDNLISNRLDIIRGKYGELGIISAFNKCIVLGDRSKLPSGLSEGDYAYFSTTEKLTYGSVMDIVGNEYALEYKSGDSFIKPTIMSDLSNAEETDEVFFYRWRVPKDNFVFSDTQAFTFKSTKNFDIAIYNKSIYDEIIVQSLFGHMGRIIFGASSLLTWDDLFIGTNFNEVKLI
jgi:hypothetical protein